MQPIKIFCTFSCDVKITFNPEKIEVLYTILSYIFCCKAILNPKRNKVFQHIFYHMSFAGKARLSWIRKGTKFSITYFITCLLQEKQGYLEPRRNEVFHHIFYHMSFAGKARLYWTQKEQVFHHMIYHMSFARKECYLESTKIFIQRGH
jgi:hypothetical protein